MRLEAWYAAQVFLTKDYLAIAMEYAAGGDMFQYVKHRGGLEEVEARWFFQQLIIGMDYCHKMACHMPPSTIVMVGCIASVCRAFLLPGRVCSHKNMSLQGVVNRDIKLENTLLDGSKRPLLKICDFGYSKNDKDSVPKSKVGTPGYTGALADWRLFRPLHAGVLHLERGAPDTSCSG